MSIIKVSQMTHDLIKSLDQRYDYAFKEVMDKMAEQRLSGSIVQDTEFATVKAAIRHEAEREVMKQVTRYLRGLDLKC